jgi:hypothetical protein
VIGQSITGDPGLKSINVINFAPGGILLIGDGRVERVRRRLCGRGGQALGQRQVRQRYPQRAIQERLPMHGVEGAEIHFRNLKIMEPPPGITSPEQTAPLVK